MNVGKLQMIKNKWTNQSLYDNLLNPPWLQGENQTPQRWNAFYLEFTRFSLIWCTVNNAFLNLLAQLKENKSHNLLHLNITARKIHANMNHLLWFLGSKTSQAYTSLPHIPYSKFEHGRHLFLSVLGWFDLRAILNRFVIHNALLMMLIY